MQFRVEDASFEGVPLAGLRCLPSDFFITNYLSENETSQRPMPADSPVSVRSWSQNEEPSTLEYTSDSQAEVLGNRELPIFAYRDQIIKTVRDNPVTILSAETGAGKSTQVPQFLLDGGWEKVFLTQPRRAASRNVYERINSEIGEIRGAAEADSLVSYRTAGERAGTEAARIKIVTDGLQEVCELHADGIQSNDVLIIDEVHEGNINAEVLMGWAKREIAKNPDLRVVIMSATMDSTRLAYHFADVCPRIPPIIEVPGRTHFIDRAEVPESTVAEEVVKAAIELNSNQDEKVNGANGILVFEPGVREIDDAMDEIRRRLPAEISKKAIILPLHAKLSVAEQQLAIHPHQGIKIVVATEVAQTSLTIPDIKYVIDSGYHRQIELDDGAVEGLVRRPVSQSDCDQRAGRAGRVCDGVYRLTRLDDKTPYVPYIERDKFPTAEILRTDIVRQVLRLAGVGFDFAELDLLHPVKPDSIERAKTVLGTLGALDDNGDTTTIGRRMDQFPIRVSPARMMVEAERYSENTRAYMAAIVASKEVGGLQHFAYNVGKRWKELTDEKSSDLLAQLDLYIATQDMTPLEMKDYDLNVRNIDRAREVYQKVAKRVNAFQETLLPPTSEEREDIRHCIQVGLVTSIYKYNGSGTYVHVGKPDVPRQISNRSVVRGAPTAVVGDAYRVEFGDGEETIVKHIIEGVTTATLADLGRVAIDLSEWKSDGFTLRSGRFVDVRRLSLFDIDLGVTEEVAAEPSPKLREAIIAHALENAGSYQTKLRNIKRQLEQLSHLAKDPVQQLTHDQIIELVREAAPADVTDPTIIDNNLRIIMETRGIDLDSFVSTERRAHIMANAPAEIEAEGFMLQVSYRKSKPLIRKYNAKLIAKLKDEIFLADGRQVYFVHERKQCSLVELQEKLGVA